MDSITHRGENNPQHQHPRPELLALGLRYTAGTYRPGNWRIAPIRTIGDRYFIRLFAGCFRLGFRDFTTGEFASPTRFRRIMHRATGVQLEKSKGEWRAVWRGSPGRRGLMLQLLDAAPGQSRRAAA